MTVDGKAIAPINGPYGGLYYSCAIGIWSAGTHTYVITATDTKGGTFSSTGTFTVVVSSVPVPAISSVAVAEAATPRNGILESSDQLKITWAASQGPIASQSVAIDGRRITTIGGPYGHLYYSCSVGAWSAGTHSYSITATNASGFSSTSSGTFNVTASAITPITIGSVVVAEAAAPWDGTLASTEALVITWAASSSNKIASQAVTIDSRTVSTIYGPYGGLYYSCPIGAWSAGSHAYTITTTDAKGSRQHPTAVSRCLLRPIPVAKLGTRRSIAPTCWLPRCARGTTRSSRAIRCWTISREQHALERLAAGDRTYTIGATDKVGNVSSFSGSFVLIASSTANQKAQDI